MGRDGRLRVPLFPTGNLYDRLVLFPFKVSAWMRDGLRSSDLGSHLATHYRAATPRSSKTVVVLGAGNVSAIPVTDTFTKLFQEGKVVLLKMSPVNGCLGPIFERALQPLRARAVRTAALKFQPVCAGGQKKLATPALGNEIQDQPPVGVVDERGRFQKRMSECVELATADLPVDVTSRRQPKLQFPRRRCLRQRRIAGPATGLMERVKLPIRRLLVGKDQWFWCRGIIALHQRRAEGDEGYY